MWGRIYVLRNNGEWFNAGHVMPKKQLYLVYEALTSGKFAQTIPCYIEWLNASELKFTNYKKKERLNSCGPCREQTPFKD